LRESIKILEHLFDLIRWLVKKSIHKIEPRNLRTCGPAMLMKYSVVMLDEYIFSKRCVYFEEIFHSKFFSITFAVLITLPICATIIITDNEVVVWTNCVLVSCVKLFLIVCKWLISWNRYWLTPNETGWHRYYPTHVTCKSEMHCCIQYVICNILESHFAHSYSLKIFWNTISIHRNASFLWWLITTTWWFAPRVLGFGHV
jgi:hypothetical protein